MPAKKAAHHDKPEEPVVESAPVAEAPAAPEPAAVEPAAPITAVEATPAAAPVVVEKENPPVQESVPSSPVEQVDELAKILEEKETVEKKTKLGKALSVIGIIFIFFLGLAAGYAANEFNVVGGAGSMLSQKDRKPVPTEASGSAAAVVSEPTPDVEVKLERSDIRINVLNGSGKTGAAGAAKVYLEGLGYSNISTGNAGGEDYENTEISIKDDKNMYLQLLSDDLKEKYQLASKVGSIASSDEYDVVIVIGKK